MLGNERDSCDADTPAHGGHPVGYPGRVGRHLAGRRRWRVAFGLVIAVSVIVLFSPQTGVPTTPPGTDKVVHAVLFAGLAATGWLAGTRRRWLVPALLAYAVVSELIQASPVLDRQASMADVAADVVGVALGLVLARWRTASPRP